MSATQITICNMIRAMSAGGCLADGVSIRYRLTSNGMLVATYCNAIRALLRDGVVVSNAGYFRLA